MEANPARDRPEIPGAPGAWRTLRAMQALLLVTIVALAAAGRDEDYWPLVTWPVYSLARPEVPGPTVAFPAIRVALADGETVTLRFEELVAPSRWKVVEFAVRYSTEPDDALSWDAETRRAWRDYLATLVRRAFAGREIVEASVWQIVWAVDAWRVPPLERDRPLREERVLTVIGPLPGSGPDAREAL